MWLGVLAHVLGDLRPGLRPTVAAVQRPQRYRWLDMLAYPVHPGPFSRYFTTPLPASLTDLPIVPRANLLTSAHSCCTRGAMAPSTLNHWTTDPAGAADSFYSMVSTAAVNMASEVAPALPVVRRSVGSETVTPVMKV